MSEQNLTLRDMFRDILKHTHNLGIYERIKLDCRDGAVIEGMNDSKDVILKASLPGTPEGFDGHVLGLARLSVLDGFFKFEGFGRDDTTISVDADDKGEPKELRFREASGTASNYRFMRSDVITSQMKPVGINEPAKYSISFQPTLQNIKDLVYFNGILGAFESSFSPKIEGDNLYFNLGDNGGDRTKILICANVNGTFKGDTKWPLDIVLKIIRNGVDGGTVTMNLFDQGLLKITVASSIGSEYNYFLPAVS